MREYVKLSPKFWTGPTGRAVRRAGVEAQLVALYLLSSPHANFIGMYHLPLVYISADTGLGLETVRAALVAVERTGFARYDEDSECVWVVESAKWQVGEEMKAADAKTKYVQKEFDALPSDCPFKREFMARYGDAYHMRGAVPASTPATKAAGQAQKVLTMSTLTPGEAKLHEAIGLFTASRDELGLSTPAGDKRIVAAALTLAASVGHHAACHALYRAQKAGDHDVQDLEQYVFAEDRAEI